MEFFNRIDERGRFCGLVAVISDHAGQADTHTYSTLYAMAAERGDDALMERILRGVYDKVPPPYAFRERFKYSRG